MSTRVSIIFPYIGDDEEIHNRLLDIIKISLDRDRGLHSSAQAPVLVLNKDTIEKGFFEKFKSYLQRAGELNILNQLSIIEVWSVDTCQMWLHGYGKIIDDKRSNSEDNTSSILQIPGI